MKSKSILRLSIIAIACAGFAHAADVTLSTGTYTDTQNYGNGTLGPGNANVATFNSGANYTFSGNLTLPGAWNHINLNSGASLNVGGSLTVDISGVSLNGGTLTTGGLYLHDSPWWNGTLNDGKQVIEYGDSVINGSTIIANQSNANFISMAGGVGAANGWVGNWFGINGDGATIDSNGFNIGITMNTGGNGGLTKSGAGTLTLTGENWYTGETKVNQGTLILGTLGGNTANGFLRGSSLLTIESGAKVQAMGANAFMGWNGGVKAVTINGGELTINDGVTTGGNHSLGNVILNGGTISGLGAAWSGFNLNGTLTVTDDSTISATNSTSNGSAISVSAGKTLNWTGTISGASSLNFVGPGTTMLSNTNTYTGNTTVAGGTLILGNGTSNSNLSDGATVNIAFGATVNLNFTGTDTVGKLIINGETMSGGTYNAGSHPDYFTGGGSLLVLDQPGTWTSGTSGNWSASSKWQDDVIATGSDKTATFSAASIDPITVTLDTPREIGNLTFSNADYTLSGGNTLTLDATTTPAISVDAGRTATVSANIAGFLGLVKSGYGTLTLTAGNTFTGETVVTGGLLQLGATSASNPQFGALENSYLLTIESGATVRAMGANAFKGWSGGTMNIALNGGTLTINDGATEGGNHNLGNVTLNGGTISGVGNSTYGGFNLSGTLTVTENSTISATHINTGNANRTVDVAAGKTLTWSGLISNGSAVGITSFTFAGTGTTVFSGANTYTGNTIVNSGLLQLTSTSQMQFVVTDAPASNQIGGTGAVSFDGVFNINTSAVTGTTGYIWLLVDRTSLTGESFGANFSVAGFTPQVDGVTWTMSDSRGTWTFSEATGELTLDIGNDYDTWKAANGVTGGPNDDDDNDGLSNHEEYAFGLDPTGGASVNPIAVQLDKATGNFSYTRRLQSLTGLNYTVWYSTNLATWTQDTGAVQGTPTVTGDVETVPITITNSLLTNPKLFVQVRAN